MPTWITSAFDEYDFGYNGTYKGTADQPTQAQQDAAWKDMELPRINRFADLARQHGKSRSSSASGACGSWGTRTTRAAATTPRTSSTCTTGWPTRKTTSIWRSTLRPPRTACPSSGRAARTAAGVTRRRSPIGGAVPQAVRRGGGDSRGEDRGEGAVTRRGRGRGRRPGASAPGMNSGSSVEQMSAFADRGQAAVAGLPSTQVDVCTWQTRNSFRGTPVIRHRLARPRHRLVRLPQFRKP